MRHQTRDLIEKLVKDHGPFTKVLDVGSLNVNGAVVDIFPEGSYLGVDMREGDNVDRIINGHDLMEFFDPESFDLVICVDTFEHDDKFWLTLENCRKLVKPGGYLFLGVPARNCPEHDHPGDYWRFMPQSMKLFLEGFEDQFIDIQIDDHSHIAEDEIYGWGLKP